MDQTAVTGFLEEVNERTDASLLLERIGYATDKSQIVGDSIKAFCPIHRDTRFRALIIDTKKRTFKCTTKTCPGYAGGNLIDLFALSKGIETVQAATEMAGLLDLQIDPGWNERLGSEMLDKAKQQAEVGDHQAAEHAARMALRFIPGHTGALLALAGINAGQGRIPEANDAYLAAAEAYLGAGDAAAADNVLAKAALLNPDNEDLLFLQVRSAELQNNNDVLAKLLGVIAAKREADGRNADNVGIYQKLVALTPDDPDAHLKFADVYEARREIKNAGRELEKAASLLLKQKRGPEAITVLEKFLRFEPQLNKYRLLLAEELVKEGDFGRAREHTLQVASAQIEQSDFAAAAQTTRKWLEVEPESIEVRDMLARIYLETDMAPDAAAQLREAAQLAAKSGNDEQSLEFLFRAKFIQHDDAALRGEVVEKLLALGQEERAGFELLDLAEFHFTREELDGAEVSLRRAADLVKTSEFQVQVAATLLSNGRSAAAREIYEKALASKDIASETALECYSRLLEIEPDNTNFVAERCRLLWETGAVHEAALATTDAATRLVNENDKPAAAKLLLLAATNASQGTGNLLELFSLCVQADQAEGAFLLYPIIAEPLRNENPEMALEMAHRALSLKPDFETALREVGYVSTKLGRKQEAGEACLALARIREDAGDFEESIEFLDQANEMLPERLDILKRKIDVLQMSGEPDLAVAVHHKYLYQLKDKAPAEEVIAECGDYLKAAPEDYEARRLLADMLAGAGRGEEANKQFAILLDKAGAARLASHEIEIRELMLSLDPNNPTLRMELGMAHHRTGNSAQAAHLFISSADNYARSGSMENALIAAREARELLPSESSILTKIVEFDRRGGKQVELLNDLEALVCLLREQKRSAEAVEAAAELLGAKPKEPRYRRIDAELKEELGKKDEAATAWVELAKLLEKDSPGEALKILGRVSLLNPKDTSYLLARVKLAEKLGDKPERESALTQLVAAQLDSPSPEDAAKTLQTLAAANPASTALGPGWANLARVRGTSAEAVKAHLAAAEAYERAGMSDDGALCLMEAIALDQNLADAHTALIKYYEKSGRPKEAFPHELGLLRIKLADGKDKTWKAQLERIRERWAAAEERLEIGRVLMSGGKLKDAIPDLESGAELCRENNNYALMLETCEADTRATNQSLILRRAKADALLNLKMNEALSGWLLTCGEAALKEGRLAEAEEFIMRLNALNPSDPDTLLQLGTLYRQQQRTQRAIETFLQAAELFRAAGEYSPAISAVHSALEIETENIPSRQLLWQVQLDADQVDDAITEMQHLADILIERRSYKDASTILSRILDYRTGSADTLQRLASLVFEFEGFGKALPYFRKLLSLRKNTGQPAEIVAEYESILRLDGAGVDLRVELADYLLETGKTDSAKQQFLQIAQIYRDELNDPLRAIEHFSRAAAINPSPKDARMFEEIATLHLGLRAPEPAAEALREASARYEESKDYQKALESVHRITGIAITSDRTGDFENAGRLYLLLGKEREATAAYRDASDLAIKSTSLSPDSKVRLLSRVLELDPYNAKCAEGLIACLPSKDAAAKAIELAAAFASGDKAETGIALLEIARDIAPDDTAVRESLIFALKAAKLDDKVWREMASLCRLRARNKEMAAARDIADKLAMLPESPELLAESASLFALCGDTERAAGVYASSAEKLAAEGKRDEAANALRSALELDRTSVPATLIANLVRNSAGHPYVMEVALDFLDAALLARSRTRALIIGTALLEGAASSDEMMGLLGRVFGRAGASFSVAVAGAHADWLFERNRADEAALVTQAVTALAPNSPDAWWLSSQFHRKRGEKEEAAASALKAAKLFAEAGAVTEEENCYKEALEEFPDDSNVLETLSFFYEREKRIGDAVDTNRRLANLCLGSREYPTAIVWLRKLLALAPGDIDARRNLADAFAKTGSPEEAVEQLLEIGHILAKQDDPEATAKVYERVLTLEPENERAVAHLLDYASKTEDTAGFGKYSILLSTIKAEAGALPQACQILKLLLQRDPDNFPALEKLAGYSRRSHDQAAYQAALMSLGDKLVSRGDYKEAIRHLETLLELQPADTELLKTLTDCCAREGMADRAADYAKRLLDVARTVPDYPLMCDAARVILTFDPTRGEIRRELGEALFGLGEHEKAVSEWSAAAEQFLTAKKQEGALSCLTRIVEAEPGNFAAMKQMAELLMVLGRPEDARNAYLALCDAYIAAAQFKNADAVIMRLSQFDPDDAVPHEKAMALARLEKKREHIVRESLWLAKYHLARNETVTADPYVREGIAADDDNMELQECRVEIATRLGRSEELLFDLHEMANRFITHGDLRKAAETLERIKETDPELVDARKELASLWLKIGEHERAYAEYAGVILLILRRNDSEQAREAAEALLLENPTAVGLRAHFAEVFVANGMPELGSRYYAACAVVAGSGGDIQSQIKYLLLATEARPRWTDGLRQLADACEAGNEQLKAAEALSRLGSALIEMKQYAEAIVVLKRHIALAPREPEPRRMLAETCVRTGDRDGRIAALQGLAEVHNLLGQTEEAVQVYRELMELRPDEPEMLKRFLELYPEVGNELEVVDEYLRLADLLTGRGQIEEATQVYERVIAVDRRTSSIREKFITFLEIIGQKERAIAETIRLADMEIGSGRRERGVSRLNAALAQNPRDSELCLSLGCANELAGNFDAALTNYAQAASILNGEQTGQGVEVYKRILKADPGSTRVRQRPGGQLFLSVSPSEAAANARKLAGIHSVRGEMDLAEAAYEMASQYEPETLEALREAIKLHDYDPSLQYLDYLRLGNRLFDLGVVDQALDAYRSARELTDEKPEIIQKCIDALTQIAPEHEAIPDYLALGERYVAMNKGELAMATYDQVLLLDPQNADAIAGRVVAQQVINANPKSGKSKRVDMKDLLEAFDEPLKPKNKK